MKQLWAHQLEALSLLKKNRSFALHMEPRTGKTAVALKWLESISQDKNLKILIIAPPVATRVWEEELHVWWKSHPSFAIASGSTEKKLKTISLDPEILITNYESLISPKIQKALQEFEPNVLVCDECFHPDTLVKTISGDKKIKDIVVGDIVLNCLGWNKVMKTFNKTVDTSYKIWFNSKEIIVSANHLFFTENGWVKAKDLQKGDLLVKTYKAMSILQDGIYKNYISINRKKTFYLFAQLWNEIKSKNSRISKIYSESEPYVFRKNTKTSKCDIKKNETQATHSSWKRSWTYCSRTKNFRKIWKKIYSQLCCSIREKSKWLSYSLQNRFSLSEVNVGYRSGWSQSSIACETKTRSKKRQEIDFVRVENIEIQKSTSDEGNPRGLFYDLEVEGHPSFTVNEVLVHNSHRCKNPSAKRSKEVKKIADRCTYRLNLTGTPVTKSYLDLFQQFLILDGGQTFGNNFYSFRAKYFEDKNASRRGAHNYFPDWVIRKDSQVAINKILSKRAYAKRKVDCLELPPFETVNVPVEMSAKQAKAYQEMKEDFITFVEGADSPSVAKFAMTKALRLQQISSGFLQTETEMIELDNQRQVVLSDLLEDLPSPIVVWACFKPNYKAIAKVCENLGKKYALLTGEQNQKEKDTAMNRWDNGEIDVLIANQGAGGIGINLSKSSNAIYYSYNFNFEHDEQSEARIYSAQSNQFSKVTRYNLVSEGTIDSQILKSLKEKSLTLDSILGACK